MDPENEEYAAQVWHQIEEDDILPSQAVVLFEKVRNRCLKDMLEKNQIGVGRILLILGILASKAKRYKLAVKYLEMCVDFNSYLVKLSKEWDDLTVNQNQIDEMHEKGRLVTGHNYLGVNLQRLGLFKEAVNHVEKSWELSKDIPNPALSSVEGTCYYNLSICALECLRFEKAIDLGEKSIELFERLPSANNDNRIQLGKTQRLISLIYSIKGNEEKSEKWLYDYQSTMNPVGAHIWLDTLSVEMEILLWKKMYTQCESRLEELLALDLNVTQRVQVLVWKLLLHYHQNNGMEIYECRDLLRNLLQENNNIEIEEKSKAVYEVARVLYMLKDYSSAFNLIDKVLGEFDGFDLDVEFDMKGHLNMLQGNILVSSNADERDVMNCFDLAGAYLNECFPKTHYVIAMLNQSIARAHLRFGHPFMSHQLLKEARDVMTSFSSHSLAFIKLNFDFVEVYIRMNKFRSAVELLKEMVQAMETGRVTPHEPFCHDSKWQCAELTSEPHETLLENAKVHLEELKIDHPYLI